MGGTDAFEAMRRACDQLLAQVGEPRPPIKLAPLARLLGAKLDYSEGGPLGREEAAIRFDNGELVLWVSRKKFENYKTRKRARFSIAHEIGHLLLFKMLGPEFLDHSESSQESYEFSEELCDFAGSQILIPRQALAAALRDRSFTLPEIRALEDLFDVSLTALLKAVADLVPDGAVIELRKYRRRPSEPVAWRVWNVSTGATSTKRSSWLPAGCTMKHILGLTAPDLLPADIPVFHSGLRLVQGRALRTRDGIAARSVTGWAQRDFLDGDHTRLGATGLLEDVQAGRVMLLVGRTGSLTALKPDKEART